MAPRHIESIEALKGLIGEHLGYSEYMDVSQERVNKFAEATGDFQWIHVDPERAKTGPYGATIAHGFLTVSLAALFLPQLIDVRGISMGLNYGASKLRFPSVVKSGSRIRGVGEMISAEDLGPGGIQMIMRITIEIEGSEKPACVIEKISRYYAA